MSIYLVRFHGLVKIGFSDNLPTRLSALMSTIPGTVEFVGHMPGGREVESYLHDLFGADRFNGEWFVESDRLKAFAALMLNPERPVPPLDLAPSRFHETRAEVADMSRRLREYAARTWPDLGLMERIHALTCCLDWKRSRIRALFYADSRVRLRAIEVRELEELMSTNQVALCIAPELGEGSE